MEKYKEIQELYNFCVENGINCHFEPFLDGYAIEFAYGADVVQHGCSYGSGRGLVEFSYTGYEDFDFVPSTLKSAKAFVLAHKDELSIKK